MKCALIIPDVHAPFHSQRAWDVMLAVARDLRGEGFHQGPDEIVCLGDFIDAYNLSSHGSRNPRVTINLEKEIFEANLLLNQLDEAFPNARKVFIEGNHETRLERFILQNASALFGVTEIKRLLKFGERLRWEWIPYGPNQAYKILGSNVLARHESLRTTPALTIREAGSSLFYGHIHRREFVSKNNLDGTKLFAGCPGWLGNSRALAFEYVRGIPNWQMGFAVLFFEKNVPYPFFVPINDDFTAVWGGKVYRG